MNIQPRTNSDRHPYIVKGNYSKLFGHLYKPGVMSTEFQSRMEHLMNEDARYYKQIDNHYRNDRKE